MLIFAVEFLPPACFMSGDPSTQKPSLKMMLYIPLIMQNQRHRFPIHNLIFEMLEQKGFGPQIIQIHLSNVTYFLQFVLTCHVYVRCLVEFRFLEMGIEEFGP